MYKNKQRRIAVYLQREASLDDYIAKYILLKRKRRGVKKRENYQVIKYKAMYSWYHLPKRKNLFKIHRYVYLEWFNKHFFNNWYSLWDKARARRVLIFLTNFFIPIKIDAKNALYRNAYVPEFKIKKKRNKALFNIGLFYGFTKRHRTKVKNLTAICIRNWILNQVCDLRS